MVDVHINVPIWKTRAVGVEEFRIVDDLRVTILYTNKSGKRHYPDPFYISRIDALSCPLHVRHGTRLRIIPIGLMSKNPIVKKDYVTFIGSDGMMEILKRGEL